MIIIYGVIAWALLLGIPLFGFRRGGSQIFATGLCLLATWSVAPALAASLAVSAPLAHRSGTHADFGLWLLLLYLVFFIGSLVLGAYLTRFIQFSFDPFDWMIGMTLGLVLAVIIVRLFLAALLMAHDGLPEQQAIDQLFLTRQIVYADGLHAINKFFTDLTTPKPVEIQLPERR